jgi:hypothetical protein
MKNAGSESKRDGGSGRSPQQNLLLTPGPPPVKHKKPSRGSGSGSGKGTKTMSQGY